MQTEGYSLCKIVTLGQKLKFSKTYQIEKTCQIRKNSEYTLCKKPLQKPPNIRKMRSPVAHLVVHWAETREVVSSRLRPDQYSGSLNH